jgi:STE24 endopeptidase
MKTLLRLVCVLTLAACAFTDAADSTIVRDFPPGPRVPEQAAAGPGFDVDRATAAWLNILSPEQRSLSDAYFEGGYWLSLWRLLYVGIGVSALILLSGLSRRMRDLAERISKGPWISVAFYFILYAIVMFILALPFSLYSSFVREHQYGLSNLSLAGWFGQQLIGLAVGAVEGAVAVPVLYFALRCAGKRWWVWATGASFVFSLLGSLIYPVFIAPLFNDFKPLPQGPTRDAVLSLARANEIPTEHLAWFDASKQTTRVSANVSGLLGVARISLNDNLLNKTSLPEIRAVLGHEMGHYVLNHGYMLTVYLSLLYGVAFAVVSVVLDYALARWGARLGLRGRADPAGLPLLFAIFSVVWFLLMPFSNTIVRTTEAEADAFGLNAAREPQGFAMSAMRLSTYRKLTPGPVEEFIFCDHPSGYERVRRSMVWLKENMPAVSAEARAAED